MPHKYIVGAENTDTRLDKFVCALCPDRSRAALQKFIKQGMIRVNGKKTTPHHFLKLRDTVHIGDLAATTAEKSAASAAHTPTRASAPHPEPEVIEETKEFMVIHKPAGLLAHPASLPSAEYTVADWLVQHDPEIKKVGDDTRLRPGIVHRLDREVSGLMVIAKTAEFFDFLKQQFQEHLVKKTYHALVYGKMPREHGVIELPIDRHSHKPRMAVRARGAAGKRAYTEYAVVKEHPAYSLLKVMIETGRTHQIRAHLHALGHPIIGDTLYTSKKFKIIPSRGICLQSTDLAFTDSAGITHAYSIPLSPIFNSFI